MDLFKNYFDGYKTLEFSDLGYWGFILVLASILIALLLANLLIKVIKPLGKALIPSPVLGGFLLLIFLSVYKAIAKAPLFNTAILEMITYHCLGLGFVASSLKKKDKGEEEQKKNNSKAIFQSSMITVSGYLIQAVIGLIISYILYLVFQNIPGKDVWAASGVLVPMGYGQGPGQALNWGTNYMNSRSGVEADIIGYILSTKDAETGKKVFTAFIESGVFASTDAASAALKAFGPTGSAALKFASIDINIAEVTSDTLASTANLYKVITSENVNELIKYCTYSELGMFDMGNIFGLAIAAMGFVSASVGGILYLAVNKKKGNPKFKGHTDETVEEESLDKYTSEKDIPVSGTIDRLSVNLGLVVLGYAISFGIIYLISWGCDQSGIGFLVNTVKPLFWGFNFIVGTGIAVLLRAVICFFEKKGAIKKNYINNYLMDRISGVLFDIMVVAAIASIDLSAFTKSEFILPLIIMSVAGGVATYIYVKAVCKHIFEKDGYYEESFLAMYGMLTGTASTGVILLREIDPEFKTPACSNMVFQSLWSVVLGAPVLLLMSFVGSSIPKMLIGLAIFAVYFVALNLILFKEKLFKKKTA